MTMPVYATGMHIDDNGNLVIDADEMAAAGVRSVEFVEVEEVKPVDIKLFCPNCAEQHIDEARPGVCETCGKGESECDCLTFTAWLNPPHKSHRCNFCNYVWRPADVPTNGVREIQTKGQRDGDSKPREAVAWDVAKSYEQRVTELEARLKDAVSILSDMHSDEGCQFKGARGKDVGCLACLAQAALSPAEKDASEGVKG